jgi:hypothetical protein
MAMPCPRPVLPKRSLDSSLSNNSRGFRKDLSSQIKFAIFSRTRFLLFPGAPCRVRAGLRKVLSGIDAMVYIAIRV